jgi:hypothetical protein
MFILAKGGQTYARMRYNVGPGADVKLPVEVDFSRPFDGSNKEAWHEEYLVNVRVPPDPPKLKADRHLALSSDDNELSEGWWRDAWGEYAEFDHHEEAEYGFIRDF